jgi:hypothetical protein
MILVGIENCDACKIAKSFLSDIQYIQLKRGVIGDTSVYAIKKALGKLNKSGKFPVVLSDKLDNIIETDDLMSNLNIEKIKRRLKE